MARETFIAYKYSEAQGLRDDIISKLGEHSTYYRGETAQSPDMTGETIHRIKENLKNMIFGTSVTIVIVSPNLQQSQWVNWEIEYSLREYKRGSTTSNTNGIIGVVMKVNGTYDWLIGQTKHLDGCVSRFIDNSKLYNIIKKNRVNLITENKYSCPNCQSFDQLNGSYISLIDEETFLNNPSKYIENAYDKSKATWNYDLSKER